MDRLQNTRVRVRFVQSGSLGSILALPVGEIRAMALRELRRRYVPSLLFRN
jgi:hypothetical protein